MPPLPDKQYYGECVCERERDMWTFATMPVCRCVLHNGFLAVVFVNLYSFLAFKLFYEVFFLTFKLF